MDLTTSTAKNKLSPIDRERLVNHIEDCNAEVEKLTEEIHRLIPLVDTDIEVYRRVRRLRSARGIMKEQMRRMEEVLRRSQ